MAGSQRGYYRAWGMMKTVVLAAVAWAGFSCSHTEVRTDAWRMPTNMLATVTGEGPILVLVGGGLTGWLSWIPHQDRLARRRSVARLQPLNVQLGLEGRSLPADYSIKMESRALGATIEVLAPEAPVDLVAWSFGAVVALDFALDHSERIRTLTLIEPPAVWVLEATGRLDEQSRRELAGLRVLHDQMRTNVDETQLAVFLRMAGLCPPGQRPQDLSQWPVFVKHRQSLRNGRALFNQTDSANRLRAFDRPVLLFKGEGSARFLHAIVDALASTLPLVEVVELPGGHAPQLVAIDAFLADLTDFQKRSMAARVR